MTPAEEFSFHRTLTVLAAHDIYVIGPQALSTYFSRLESETRSQFRTKLFEDNFFSSIAGYNRLLKSKAFYSAFDEYEYVLIAQTDALIISDSLNDWCDRGYSYVGAPWFSGFDAPRDPLSFWGVGNGGLSLRKVSDCITVLTGLRYIPNSIDSESAPHQSLVVRLAKAIKHRAILAYNLDPFKTKANEDLFWGMLVSKSCNFFTVPKPEEAARFAFEVAPEYLYEFTGHRLPFGCHAWERYNPQFWQSVLGEIGLELPKPHPYVKQP